MRQQAEHIPTTVDLLELARKLISKEKYGGQHVSNNALAKQLGWDASRLRNYLAGRSCLDEAGCQTVATALDWPLETVLACVSLERAKRTHQDDTVTRAWQRICQHVAMGAVCFCVGFSSVFILPL